MITLTFAVPGCDSAVAGALGIWSRFSPFFSSLSLVCPRTLSPLLYPMLSPRGWWLWTLLTGILALLLPGGWSLWGPGRQVGTKAVRLACISLWKARHLSGTLLHSAPLGMQDQLTRLRRGWGEWGSNVQNLRKYRLQCACLVPVLT